MAGITMLKREEMFAFKQSSFPKGDNFQNCLGILMCQLWESGSSSRCRAMALHATETLGDKRQFEGLLGSFADFTFIFTLPFLAFYFLALSYSET